MPKKEDDRVDWDEYLDDKDPDVAKYEEEHEQIVKRENLNSAGGGNHSLNRITIETARKLAQENSNQERKFQVENIGIGGKEVENSIKNFRDSQKKKPK